MVAVIALVVPWPSWSSRQVTVAAPVTQPVVLFDGFCGLCNGWVDFLLRRDRRAALRFLPLQETAAVHLREAAGLPLTDPDSIVVWSGRSIYTESSGVLFALEQLGGAWRSVRLLAAIPPRLRDGVYRFIAARRYAWFGQRENCRIPSAEERTRFLGTA